MVKNEIDNVKDSAKKIKKEAPIFALKLIKGCADEIVYTFSKGLLGVDLRKDVDVEGSTNNSIPKIITKDNGTYFATEGGLLSTKLYFPFGDWLHKIIIGSTGSGKSMWGSNYVINADHGCCFIDNAKGEAIDLILRSLSPEKLEKTVVLDHSDKHNPLAVGMIESADDIFKADMITDQWVNFFISNFGIEDKFRTQNILKHACKAVFGLDNATILDVIELIKSEDYRNKVISKLSSDYRDVKEFWNGFDEMSDGQKRQYIDPILNRTGILMTDTNLKTTLGQIPNRKLEYKKWMDEGWNVLIKVPGEGDNRLSSTAVKCITALHVLSFWQAGLRREGVWNKPSKQFTVIADEPQNWLGSNEKALDDIFSKARKSRLNIMCLIQSTEQIKDESSKLLKVILHNQPDILAFSETEIFKDFDFESLKQWHFLAKMRNGQFVAKAPAPPKKLRDQKEINKIIERCKDKYNKNFEIVRSNIERRYRNWLDQSMNVNQCESQTNTSKTSLSQDSQKETTKSSSSSIRIE